MCICYKEKFKARTQEQIRKKIRFHCKCQGKHFHDTLFCKNYPFGAKLVSPEIEKCLCKDGLSHKICGVCLSVRYLLSFKCFKICVEKVPDEFIEKVVSFSYYVKQINCDSFFFFSKNAKTVEISLDNPDEEEISVLTDH